MDQPPSSKLPITSKQHDWLKKQISQWQAGNIITTDQSQAILSQYESPQQLQSRATQLLFTALTALAAVMCAAGVLLLIGYNWAAIPRMLKVILIFAAVAATFATSTYSYSKNRPIVGEVLALLGTLFYGSAIWLLAQIFHIESHYPDGVMWWMIGALGTAWLVRSTIIGIEAIILATIWVIMEASSFHNPNYLYLPFAATILGFALIQTSGWLVALWCMTTSIWILATSVAVWKPEQMTPAILVLFACGCYVTSRWYRKPGGLARVWQISGLGLLLIPLMALTFKDVHSRWYGYQDNSPIYYASLSTVVLLLGWVGISLARRGVSAIKSDLPILLIAIAAFTDTFVLGAPNFMGTRFTDPIDGASLSLVFNALVLVFSIWLMVRGIRLDRSLSFFTGLIYLLIFVIVRYIALIGDMISSALLFFIAGAVLFAAAWFWRKRKVILKSEATNE